MWVYYKNSDDSYLDIKQNTMTSSYVMFAGILPCGLNGFPTFRLFQA